jgi:uncharacterized protein
VRVEWDQAKSIANQKKHGVSFTEAERLFTSGVDYLEIFDEAHSIDEDRFIAVGPVASRILLVVFTERDGDTVRIISARKATRAENELYRRHLEKNR